MKAKVLRIHWHDKQPVFSADFDPRDGNRIATAGGDNQVRVWRISKLSDPVMAAGEEGGRDRREEEEDTRPEYLATLSRHLKSVNCVRFSHSGEYLASAGDGGSVLLWKKSTSAIGHTRHIFGAEQDSGEEEEEGEGGDGKREGVGSKEFWLPLQTFRASDGEDIYDLCWSPDDRHLLFGLTDNTAQLWEVSPTGGKCIKVLRDHRHFVQGVAWDPLGRYFVTESADRSVKIWQLYQSGSGVNSLNVKLINKLSKQECSSNEANIPAGSEGGMRGSHIFHDETLVTFFRRPSFSPDGSLLLLPAGMYRPEGQSTVENCIFIMARGQLEGGAPVARIEGFNRPVLGVKCCGRLFNSIATPHALGTTDSLASFQLPYRVVYAAFTMDSVAIFDTRQSRPIVSFKDLHYGSITDVAWSPDGTSLLVTATDGFCSLISFEVGELGSEPMAPSVQDEIVNGYRRKFGLIGRPKASRHVLTALMGSGGDALSTGGGALSTPAFLHLPGSSSDAPEDETGATTSASTPPTTTAATNQSSPAAVNELPTNLIKRRIQPTLIS